MKYYVSVNGSEHVVELTEALGELRVALDGRRLDVRYEEVDRLGRELRQGQRRAHAWRCT